MSKAKTLAIAWDEYAARIRGLTKEELSVAYAAFLSGDLAALKVVLDTNKPTEALSALSAFAKELP